ncbi:sensor histidine kinase-like protein/response regulator [Paraphoma chrysanthemicola]|uniref:histidine kinase n=1 Tax=Paraphoma chrysanthemicola TaxID=798071 RepID=A0A8K0RGJ9_9PLEO|nr:sensor histidine kinase-like protein/response regulator [Paraphoma chrysanthemicola]
MEPPSDGHRKAISEDKRERDVFLLYGAAFHGIPHLDNVGSNPETCSLPGDHVPRPSTDPTLTALAQLATFRLGAGRSMISLIDDQRQYILAEATPDMSVHPSLQKDVPSTLWLGSVSIPRSWGMCEKVLNLDLQDFMETEYPALVIRDLRESVQHADRTYIKESNVRFYAGAPLISPTGAIVGSVCILDDEPRPGGLSKEHCHSLRDIASSVMEYLHTYTIKDQFRRGERFTRGLISFSEGASALLPFENVNRHDLDAPTALGTFTPDLSSPNDERSDPMKFQQVATTDMGARPSVWIRSSRQRSIKKLQETILPQDSRSMFARAASVMMASSDIDGVLILDASVAANKGGHPSGSPERNTETGTETAGDSYQSKSSSSDESENPRPSSNHGSSWKTCQILGSATSGRATYTEDGQNSAFGSLPEASLTRMLSDYPHGRIITFGADGMPLSSTEDSGTTSGISKGSGESPKRKTSGSRASRMSKAVHTLLPDARSVAFVPFWDYERSRWFAGCLCWTNSTHRLLSASVDLPYFKVFSHSIMRELSRLDALALNQAKTTFVASISHELRSPLHGILGTLEFIKDTPLDSFQTSMLNSLNACGQTLLDTINHVMDYAKISDVTRNVSSRRLKSTHTIRLSSKPIKSRRSRAGAFDLSIATEEVVEAVFSGSSYVPVSGTMMDEPTSPSESGSDPLTKRKTCYVVLDLSSESDWVYCFPVGSWRRIVMNIFGNAIKYTESGYIYISLRVNDGGKAPNTPTTVTLTITDSGKGMSPQFLADKAFQPFSQENPFAAGTGLGLSIVRQIIETNGGKIEVSSEPSVGTRLTVKLALTRPDFVPTVPPQRAQLTSFLPRLEGRSICILRADLRAASEGPSSSKPDSGLTRFTNALVSTLESHLKMHVVQTATWDTQECDLVIVPELSFEYLKAIRRARINGGRAPVTIFVAMDALEAATLRSDARVQKRESVVEIMTQPCGPYKLAYILNQCLDRYDLPDENLQHQSSGSESPRTAGLSTKKAPNLPDPTIGRTLESPTLVHEAHQAAPEEALPVSVAAPEQAVVAMPVRPTLGASQVLIVDDNAINRSLLVAYMKKYNYAYQEAENGLQALEAYRSNPTKFKILLMDMSMPIMDGMTSTRAIREYEHENNMKRCRIVALTGLASASARLEALNSGVDHFMTKPLNFKALGALLKREDNRRNSVTELQSLKHTEGKEKAELPPDIDAGRPNDLPTPQQGESITSQERYDGIDQAVRNSFGRSTPKLEVMSSQHDASTLDPHSGIEDHEMTHDGDISKTEP